jgi:hypothetical protein
MRPSKYSHREVDAMALIDIPMGRTLTGDGCWNPESGG